MVSLGVDAEKDTVGDFGVTVAGYREAGRDAAAVCWGCLHGVGAGGWVPI